ncbi:MAG: hypothetical protein A2053_02290 [Deltaproteobacteria bacterium GWA2_50_8]|nr:MAG: hypothetical protein A2053_02290 [Deltaproteobacteria bacterium GWA2_50_8]
MKIEKGNMMPIMFLIFYLTAFLLSSAIDLCRVHRKKRGPYFIARYLFINAGEESDVVDVF